MKQNNLVNQWRQGPVSNHSLEPGRNFFVQYVLFFLDGRGIFCMDIQNNHLVTGSADHGLRCYNLGSNKYERELYSKRYGHAEWVTSVTHCPNGRIISAGMDSKLCYWDAKGVRCDDLKGHQGSVTKVMVDSSNIAITGSYDCTLMLWNLNGLSEGRKFFGPHKSAVMDFDWNNSLLVSGDRQGVVSFWDINEGEPVMFKTIHSGAVAKVKLFSDGGANNLVLTSGTNDGVLAIHDMRTNKIVHQQQLHKGAINSLAVNLQNFIITGSGDSTLKLIDIVAGFKPVCVMKATDAVFCVDYIYNLTIAGCGDGNILVYNNDNGECLYGFGAMTKGSVRQMQMNQDKTKLVVVGDDFNPMVLQYQ